MGLLIISLFGFLGGERRRRRWKKRRRKGGGWGGEQRGEGMGKEPDRGRGVIVNKLLGIT